MRWAYVFTPSLLLRFAVYVMQFQWATVCNCVKCRAGVAWAMSAARVAPRGLDCLVCARAAMASTIRGVIILRLLHASTPLALGWGDWITSAPPLARPAGRAARRVE